MQSDPEFAQAISGNDLNKLQEILRQRHHQRAELRKREEEELVSNSIGDIFLHYFFLPTFVSSNKLFILLQWHEV